MLEVKILKVKKVGTLEGVDRVVAISKALKDQKTKFYETKTKRFVWSKKVWYEISLGMDMYILKECPKDKKFTKSKIKTFQQMCEITQ